MSNAATAPWLRKCIMAKGLPRKCETALMPAPPPVEPMRPIEDAKTRY